MQVQAALTAVTDDIKETVWFIIIYCFLTVGSVKFCNYLFQSFPWGEIDSFWVLRGGI